MDFLLFNDNNLIENSFSFSDSSLISDIIMYRDMVYEGAIPNRLRLLDEYQNLFSNIVILENKMRDMKNVSDSKSSELSQRNSRFRRAKEKINRLDDIKNNCDILLREHDKYLYSISNKVQKIDEKKFVTYKLRELNNLLSS